jgi:hypothetical protein
MMTLAVFVTDFAISFMGWQRLDAWLTGNRLRCVAWNVALDLAIAVNTIGFIDGRWWMLVPSLLGSALGTLAAFRWRIL